MDITLGIDQHILEEEYDEDYDPTEAEVLEYCKVLGLDPFAEKDFLFIAREGIKAPLPKEWKPVEDQDGNIYYFNFATGESTWEHPCDEFYRKLLQQERDKKSSSTTNVKTGKKKGEGKKKGQGQKGNVPKVTSNKKLSGGLVQTRQAELGQTPPLPLEMNVGNDAYPGKLTPLPSSQPVGGRLTPLAKPGGISPLTGVGGLPLLKSNLTSLGQLSLSSGAPLPGSGKNGSLKSDVLLSNTNSGSLLGKNSSGSILGSGSIRSGSGSVKNGSGSIKSGSGSVKSGSGNVLGKSGSGSVLGKSNNGLLKNSNENKLGTIGTVELGSIKISNQYEEEEGEDSDFDSEEDSDSDMNAQFKSKLGVNLLGAKDLGLKDSAEEDSMDSSEDVNKELCEVMGLDDSCTEFNDKDSPAIPPTPVFGSAPKEKLHSGGGSRGGLLGNDGLLQSSSPVGTLKHPVTQHNGRDASHVTATDHQKKPPAVVASNEAERELLQSEHDSTIVQIKKSHAEQLEKLRQQLASEQLSEEKELRAKMALFLSELKARLQEEKEEEEAKLMEEKQDNLRKLKQQIAIDLEKEKKELHRSTDMAITSLKQELSREREDKEKKLRLDFRDELNQLSERLKNEIVAEREELEAVHGKEMNILRQKSEEELKRKREELEKKNSEDLEEVQQQIKKKHEDAISEVRAKTEKEFNVEELRSGMRESYKEAEMKMKEKLDAELEMKKSELISQHEAELNSLKKKLRLQLKESEDKITQEVEAERKKLESELNSAKVSHVEKHESEIRELQAEHRTIRQQIELEKLDQSRVLESMQLEYKTRKDELARLKKELDQQISSTEVKRQSLLEEEEELKSMDKKLAQLRSANSNEEIELVKNQKSELKDTIKKEKEALASLKRTQSLVESELQQLNEHKTVMQSSVEKLAQKEYKIRVAHLANEIKHFKSSLRDLKQKRMPITNSHSRSTYMSTSPLPEVDEMFPFGPNMELSSSMQRRPLAHTTGNRYTEESGSDEEETWMKSDDDDDGGGGDIAMNVQELEPVFKAGNHLDKFAALEDVKAKLTEHQRELCNTLAHEKHSISKTKAYLREQHKKLKDRQIALEYSQREWNEGMRRRKGKKEDGNFELMKEIQSKLDQEAVALSELEERMKTSNKLVTLKEEAVSQLQDLMEPETASVDTSQPLAPIQPTSPWKHDFSRLDAALERNRHKTKDFKPSSKIPRSKLTPPVLRASHKSSTKELGLRLYSEDSSGTSSDKDELSSSNSDIIERRSRAKNAPELLSLQTQTPSAFTKRIGEDGWGDYEPPKSLSHYAPPPLMGGDGRDDHGTSGAIWTPNARSIVSTQELVSLNQKPVLDSLNSINSQLGELLNRVGPSAPSPFITHRQSHVPFLEDRPVGGSSVTRSTSGFSARWADPVGSVGHGDDLQNYRQSYLGSMSHSDVDLQKNRQSYLGQRHSFVGTPLDSTTVSSTASRQSMEELVRNQTDWLKEFRQTVPLSSQLRSNISSASSVPPPPPPTTLHVAPVHGHLRSQSLLPSRPRLILDKSNNIQLVHL